MVRPLTMRLLACILAITSGFAVPVSALAHGHEHHLEAEAGADHHADEHHSMRDAAHESSAQAAVLGGLELQQLPSDDPGSHQHPCLDRARSNRVECPAFALLTPTVVVAFEQAEETAPVRPVLYRLRPRALDHAPPPPSRAPPATPG